MKLYNSSNEEKYDASQFTGSPLPDMNIPDHWCTEHGMKIMKGTGNYIWSTMLKKDINLDDTSKDRIASKRGMQIQFVTDTSQRDLDSSFALYEGLQDAIHEGEDDSQFVTGLLDIQYDPQLFHPFSERDTTPLCDSNNIDEDRLMRDVKDRLQKLPPPGLLNETLVMLERLGGVGSAGSLLSIEPNGESFELTKYFSSTKDTEIKFQGAVNIIKLYAQMMFYSRAVSFHLSLNKVFSLNV